ncbi:MAG: flagellar basal body P-ring protein FlgI [Zhongshania sp.]|uniref:flagellar basal body P-ring protein FlgI n=1 Tax=Zhongshania sp. TaxID=1971902 RepID=UPI00261E97A4|nr:flagellar basal body P-ring protein FlgI [Zhongshania sp.]MDF1690895.1 flagellar basal body P-ring protein FlgI [Zhongshania sp.]
MSVFKSNSFLRKIAAVCSIALFAIAPLAQAERVKDLVNVAGVRENQLVGYGLVVGLSGTGDQTSQAQFTIQSIRNMLTGFGVRIPDNVSPQLKNVAAVTVHASLPAFAKPGQTLDVTVSSIGNSASLRGGSLLMAPMMGADGQVYAVAQGSLLVGGLGVAGADGSKVTVNIPSAGRIPNGAIIERAAPSAMSANGEIMLNLKKADFTTAHRLVEEINSKFGAGTASAMDSATVKVLGPSNADRSVTFISMLETLEITPAEAIARVVVNSRTGTIVIGGNVRVMPAAVTHGSLTVSITERVDISQPGAFSGGQTVAAQESSIDVQETGSRMFLLDAGVTLEEIVKAINKVGAAPSDLVAILEALDQAGALRAELLVI